MITWGVRQRELVDLWRRPEKRIISTGSVRSGKTESSLTGFLVWAGLAFSGHRFMLSAHTRTQVANVLLPIASKVAAAAGVHYRERAQEKKVVIGTNEFLTFDAQDRSAAKRIQGLTLAGAYCDEAVTMPRDFIDELEQRTSEPGAKIVMTGNPGSPGHWLKRDYIDRGDDCWYHPLGLVDNPAPWVPRLVESLLGRLTGHMLRRRVLGEWAAAIGLVYPSHTARPRPHVNAIDTWDIAADYGAATTTHALLVGREADTGTWWIYDEWVHRSMEAGKVSDATQAERLRSRFGDVCDLQRIRRIWIDPAAASFKAAMRQAFPSVPVRNAFNHVEPGIDSTRHALDLGKVLIHDGCDQLLGEIGNYEWDEKAAARGEDRPVKAFDHGCDALRYWCHSTVMAPRFDRIKVAGSAW